MSIAYKKIDFYIELEDKALFSMPPAFVFRSIIGAELKRMCCIARGRICTDCILKNECIYSHDFETIVPKDAAPAKGCDRVSHPTIIESEPFDAKNQQINNIKLTIIFLGFAIRHISYYYYALNNGGRRGILKERIKYKIKDAVSCGRSLIVDENNINTDFAAEVFNLPDCNGGDAGQTKSILVQLLTPLRFKLRGAYTQNFDGNDFKTMLYRRLKTLCAFYGEAASLPGLNFLNDWVLDEKSFLWQDYTHYSARQKSAMRLGGITGSMVVSGRFNMADEALLSFSELFHAGKNTNFGLGKMRIWKEQAITR